MWDTQIGRMVDEIDRLGYGDNTLILYIWGDNGACLVGVLGREEEADEIRRRACELGPRRGDGLGDRLVGGAQP